MLCAPGHQHHPFQNTRSAHGPAQNVLEEMERGAIWLPLKIATASKGQKDPSRGTGQEAFLFLWAGSYTMSEILSDLCDQMPRPISYIPKGPEQWDCFQK